MAREEPPLGEHDWVITNWEYDDTFFKCKRCHKKTNCRRGYPAKDGCTLQKMMFENA